MGKTENARSVNRKLIKLVSLKLICVHFDSPSFNTNCESHDMNTNWIWQIFGADQDHRELDYGGWRPIWRRFRVKWIWQICKSAKAQDKTTETHCGWNKLWKLVRYKWFRTDFKTTRWPYHHFSFQKGACECPLCGLQWGDLRSRLEPDSQSDIM